MKRQTVPLPITVLLIGVAACTASPAISSSTVTLAADPRPSSTITPLPAFLSTPTPTAPPLPFHATSSTQAYTIPVELTYPIAMISEPFRVVVTGVSPAGEQLEMLEVPKDWRADHYFLQLELSVENLTNDPIAFGTARTGASLAIKSTDGSLQYPAGGCQNSRQNCAPVFVTTLIDHIPIDVFVLFIVPSETKQIYLYLLGPVPIPHYNMREPPVDPISKG